jgi:type II secretory pathway pseudopilin PulG
MRPPRRAAGFTYLTILFVVAIMGIGLALTGEVWHTAAMREREAALLWTGEHYRRAIERYYLAGPRQYPRELTDLLKDSRKPVVERYLRKLYPDPITNSDEWGVVKAPLGGVMGVYSRSEEKPLKEAGFKPAQAEFQGAKKYSDWKFVYVPPAAQQQPTGSKAVSPQPGGSKSPARINP